MTFGLYRIDRLYRGDDTPVSRYVISKRYPAGESDTMQTDTVVSLGEIDLSEVVAAVKEQLEKGRTQ